MCVRDVSMMSHISSNAIMKRRGLILVLFWGSVMVLALNLAPISRTAVCRRCRKTFEVDKNTPKSCNYHKGRFLGAENSKHTGTKMQGMSYFWDCCDLEIFEGKGCMTGLHVSYDEEDTDTVMLNKNLEQIRGYYNAS